MPQVINTNILSLTAQRNLNNTQSSLATAMQRLSSGLRINSAKDDAAGLAIATRFTTQINGLNTAVRNANDGISLAQTTGSALAEVTDNLQAIRTLAVQSANATNSDSDRAALDNEVQQRLDEITRIARQTTFNGRHVLDGSFGSAAFQVGANVGETITVDLTQGTSASDIGGVATVSDNVSTAFASGGLSLASGALSFAFSGTSAPTASIASGTYASVQDLADAINAAVSGAVASGVAAQASGFATVDATTGELDINDVFGSGVAFSGSSLSALGLTSGTIAVSGSASSTAAVGATTGVRTFGAGDFSINGTDITGTFDSTQDVVDAINSTSIPGVTAYVDGNNLVIQSNGADVKIGGTGAQFGALGMASGTTQAASSLANANVKTVADANDVINRVDAALTTISGVRSQLGAIQNRFDSTISNLQAISENLSASRSRIEDTDFAAETANLSRSQILQQAGVAMLAQANVAPQTVLKLLQ